MMGDDEEHDSEVASKLCSPPSAPPGGRQASLGPSWGCRQTPGHTSETPAPSAYAAGSALVAVRLLSSWEARGREIGPRRGGQVRERPAAASSSYAVNIPTYFLLSGSFNPASAYPPAALRRKRDGTRAGAETWRHSASPACGHTPQVLTAAELRKPGWNEAEGSSKISGEGPRW
ncbi:hypothetical protein GQ53DRAFT_309110 [Thozetella sp. PMI_491]|nr:hypothetical protein GQ53DRAFT_309110 [Thozetella sp. PMI_491]